jgi:hypothetical protein
MNRISDLRQLCRLMDASARLAEIDGKRAEAMQSGLDVIRVANNGTRGGLLIDAMTGFACERVGQRALARLRDQFSADECRTLITALTAIDDEREPIVKIVKRDMAWSAKQYNFFNRTMLALNPRANLLLQPSIDAFELASKQAEARLRLLFAELAARRYRLEEGREPSNLEALVPRYLPKVPVDPYSGRPIRYRLDPEDGHRLYCVGPDERDDGGKALPERSDWRKARGDVLVDPAEALSPPSNPATPKTPSAETP